MRILLYGGVHHVDYSITRDDKSDDNSDDAN
jgi:hypothetical protein